MVKVSNLIKKYFNISSFNIEKNDFIGLAQGYLGVLLLSWWGIWSGVKYNMPFTHFSGFITSAGGLL